MRVLGIVFFVAAALVVLAIIIPLLHLALVAAVVVAAAIFSMSVWKVMFGQRRKVMPAAPTDIARLHS